MNVQQNPEHPGLISRFLHGHQILNLTEGHHPLDLLLWESIFEDSKLSGVLGDWVAWIHEKLQLYQIRLVRFRPINLFILKKMGKGVLLHMRMKIS
jgi:hypothetical protein